MDSDLLTSAIGKETVQFQEDNGNQNWNGAPLKWAKANLVGKTVELELTHDNKFTNASIVGFTSDRWEQRKIGQHCSDRIAATMKNPFHNFAFQRIAAERDIVPEVNGGDLFIDANGRGMTRLISRYITDVALDRDVVERTLLDALNSIFHPDAEYLRILVQQRNVSDWEIFLDEAVKGRIAMSHTGSGLKTILLVLANLHIAPKLAKKPSSLSDFLFGFEELENHLHPAIQRRLFHYLRDFAVEHRCHFFITTHSNVVIDQFSGDDHAQLLHVTHDGKSAQVCTVETNVHGANVLDDLDIRASDLLQTNVVIWCEGPSDRTYFGKWVELWTSGELIEGIHFQCIPFGGSCNAYLTFCDPTNVDELIPALKINRHAILLADSDRRNASDELKPHTERLRKEVDAVGGYSWITAGREVENYIPVDAYQSLWGNLQLQGPNQFDDALEYIASLDGHKTKPSKPAFAQRICPHLKRQSLESTLDLGQHLDEVCRRIRKWNRLAQPI